MENELNIKETVFNKIIHWIEEVGGKVEVLTRKASVDAEIQFEAKCYPVGDEGMFYLITFNNKLRDCFTIGANMYFKEEDAKSIEGLTKKDRDQIFIDIRKLTYPLHIDLTAKFPATSFYKLIFIDSLKEKQYFFDCVSNLLNAMQLVSARFDEVRNSFYPKGTI